LCDEAKSSILFSARSAEILCGGVVTVVYDPLAVVRTASHNAGDGVYLGSGMHGPVWATPERAVLVLGPPRSGKTSSIIVPSVLAANGPVISTSTKPDVMTFTAPSRGRAGETLLYDPSGTVERPNGVAPLAWSPVSACSQWDEALLVARLMVVSSTGGSIGARQLANGLDNHWHERSSALLAALLHSASLEGAPMSAVLRWVDRHQSGPAQSILDQAGNELAGDLLGGIATTDQRELSGIWSTASGVLNAYHSNAAMASTTGPAFDPAAWCETRGTIYICASARHQEMVSPLVVALLSEIRTATFRRDTNRKANRNIDLAKVDRGQRGESPLLFALDEMANIAPLPDLQKTLGDGGGQGLITLACLQDMSQARARWGPEADGWLSLFGATVMLRGIEDVRTLEMLSTLAGEEEVVTRSLSSPVDTGEGPVLSALRWLGRRPAPEVPKPTVTTSTVRRRRMPVDQLSRGREGMALVIDESSSMSYVGLTPFFSEEPWRSVVNQGLDLGRSTPNPGYTAPGHPPPGLSRPPPGLSRHPEALGRSGAEPQQPGFDFGP
jgi:type IV secretion system protein VirD4